MLLHTYLSITHTLRKRVLDISVSRLVIIDVTKYELIAKTSSYLLASSPRYAFMICKILQMH